MAKADAGSRGPEVHIEQAIGRLYRFLSANRWTRFPWAVVQTFSKAEGALLSGSMAYYTFLSLLPLLMVAAFVIVLVVSAISTLYPAFLATRVSPLQAMQTDE